MKKKKWKMNSKPNTLSGKKENINIRSTRKLQIERRKKQEGLGCVNKIDNVRLPTKIRFRK